MNKQDRSSKSEASGVGYSTNALTGHLEAVEITRLVKPAHNRKKEQSPDELCFTGRPISKSSKAHELRVVFVEDEKDLPKPSFDAAHGRIDLYYAKGHFRSVHGLLTGRDPALCYFWSSADGSRRLAWLLKSAS
jgi:hypothetical protein